MKPKKTIQVSFIKDKINELISNEKYPLNYDKLEALTDFLHIVLHSTGNYNGFMYLDNNDSKIYTVGNLKRKYF